MAMKVLRVKEAREILKENGFTFTIARLEMGLRQRVYPFGDAVEMPGGTWVYAVYSVLRESKVLYRLQQREVQSKATCVRP